MQGLHLIADLRGCTGAQAAMTDPDALHSLCVREVGAAGLHAVNALFHRFEAAGVTGVVLLAESHLAVHTWPELRTVTLDVYVCNFSVDNAGAARRLMAALIDAFAPAQIEQHELQRGRSPALSGWQ